MFIIRIVAKWTVDSLHRPLVPAETADQAAFAFAREKRKNRGTAADRAVSLQPGFILL